MAGEVRTTSSTVEVEPVGEIALTDTVSDGSGGFVRAFRVFGVPPSEGGGSAPLLHEIKMFSTDPALLSLTTKPLKL